MKKTALLTISLFLFACNTSKQITKTETSEIEIIDKINSIQLSETQSNIQTRIIGKITKTFFSQPDSTGKTHITKTEQTELTVFQEESTTQNNELQQTENKTAKNKTCQKQKEITKNKHAKFIIFLFVFCAILFTITMYRKSKI